MNDNTRTDYYRPGQATGVNMYVATPASLLPNQPYTPIPRFYPVPQTLEPEGEHEKRRNTIFDSVSVTITQNMTRDEAIARLRASGMHIASIHVPEGARELTSGERELLGRVPLGAPTTTEIIDEDRE